jgi:hypothetical protein
MDTGYSTVRIIALSVALTSALLLGGAVPSGAASWTHLTNLALDNAGTMLLLTDGTVMVQGYSPGNNWMRLTPDRTGSYINGTWSALASMSLPRLYYASHILPSGKVWLLGGEYSGFGLPANWTNTGEMYDPVSNTWSSIAHHPEANFGDDPTMLLRNGQILAGSLTTRNTYLYDIATNTWSFAAAKVYNDQSDEEGWVKLPDGSVLTYDIFQSVATSGSYAEQYDPATNTWSSLSPSDGTASGFIPQLSSAALGAELGPLLRLQDGRIFAIGATGHTALYTPSTNTWVAGPDIIGSLSGTSALFGADDAPGAVMPNGHVLFAADAGPTRGTFSPPTQLFDFDPDADTILPVAPPIPDANLNGTPAFVIRMLILPTGQVLFSDGSRQLWVYTPDGAAPQRLKPRIEGVKYNGGGVFTLTGQQLNGQDAGSNYGDDVESDENYPIVQLIDKAGNVFYARTTNWSTTEVATGVVRETVNFTLPPAIVPGLYRLVVSGAGIASSSSVSRRITAEEIQGL